VSQIDHNAKANPFVIVFLVLVIMASPALVVMLPEYLGALALGLILPAAGITLGFITNNMGRDRKYNRKL